MKTMYRRKNPGFLPGFCGFLALLILAGGRCSTEGLDTEKGPTGTGSLTIVSWNIQAMFDGADNGFEYDEYKNAAGWNKEKYEARLTNISKAIKEKLTPDILALIEVENSGVLEDLSNLLKPDYPWSFFAGSPGASIGLGLLSRYPFLETKAHTAKSADGSNTRPVTEIRVKSESGPLVLFVCHWKSKLGGDQKTEHLRRADAGILSRRIAEIRAENNAIPVIVMGDLNENHNEFEKIEGAYISALLPDTDAAAAALEAAAGTTAAPIRPGFQDYLVISGQKPPQVAHITNAAAVLYSPWIEYPEDQGSYYYRYGWETIDHFLLNNALFDNSGWEYESFWVASELPFSTSGGRPYAYNPKTGNGFSDHFPIVLQLGNNDKTNKDDDE
jgi:endonuclease/exonuclease/phosphatase family metal-dependent hydrolase